MEAEWRLQLCADVVDLGKGCAYVNAKGVRFNRGIRKCHLNKICSANAAVVQRPGQPLKIPMDDVSWVDENVSQGTKCIQLVEHRDGSCKEARQTNRLVNADAVVSTSFDVNIAVQKGGQTCRWHVFV